MTSKNSPRKRQRPRVRLPLWMLGLLSLAFLFLFISSSVWLYRTMQQQVLSVAQVTEPDFSSVTEPMPDEPPPIGAPAITVQDEPLPVISADAFKPWSGTERVTFLLLGIDQRCEETGPTHTDTMIVVTLDPVAKSAAILSLPRDLWVDIPSFQVDRINQAHYLGQVYEYPGGGPALAVETVEATLGIPINYYAAVNFDAFVEMIDLIGGIVVEVPETIDDQSYPDRCYGYDPFYIDAGTHRLNGTTALKYARTRATFGGDVDRAVRQQAVIMAVRDQLLRLDMLPQLITDTPELWRSFQKNVRTNVTPDEAIQLALLVQEIPSENIRTAVIDYDYVYNETTPDGRQVLVPIRDKIRLLRDQLFAPPAIPDPTIEDLPDLLADEDARVAVFNGTQVFGLAAATQEYLQEYEINVTEIGNADSSTYRATQIIDYGDHPYTLIYLVQLMQMPPLNTSDGNNPEGDYDILIILGSDWSVPES